MQQFNYTSISIGLYFFTGWEKNQIGVIIKNEDRFRY